MRLRNVMAEGGTAVHISWNPEPVPAIVAGIDALFAITTCFGKAFQASHIHIVSILISFPDLKKAGATDPLAEES